MIMGNAENPNFSIGIHSPLALPYQVPVVQKVVSTIHWIMLLIFVLLMRWIVIYPVDSAFQRLNNRGLSKVAGNSKVSIGHLSLFTHDATNSLYGPCHRF